MVNDGKRGGRGYQGKRGGRGRLGNTPGRFGKAPSANFPAIEALRQICRHQVVPLPEYIWDQEAKSVTLCHFDRIITVKGAGDKSKACQAAADIMMSGFYGEHELLDQHEKLDKTAEKAMDTPKWEAKVKQFQSEEGKQERITAIEANERLTDEKKQRYIESVHNDEPGEALDYVNVCESWHARQRTLRFNFVCRQCKLQNRIINPNAKPRKPKTDEKSGDEGESATKEEEPSEEPTEEPTEDEAATTQNTLKATVWKNGDKDNTLLEMDVSGEDTMSSLRIQLIDNALQQLLADEHITQAAIDKPLPKPVQPKPNQQMMVMMPMQQGRNQQMMPMQMMPMQQGMVPMMNPMMMQQMMMMPQMMMPQMMAPQMMMPQMNMMNQPMMHATGPVKRGKRPFRGGRGRGKKAKKTEE